MRLRLRPYAVGILLKEYLCLWGGWRRHDLRLLRLLRLLLEVLELVVLVMLRGSLRLHHMVVLLLLLLVVMDWLRDLLLVLSRSTDQPPAHTRWRKTIPIAGGLSLERARGPVAGASAGPQKPIAPARHRSLSYGTAGEIGGRPLGGASEENRIARQYQLRWVAVVVVLVAAAAVVVMAEAGTEQDTVGHAVKEGQWTRFWD